KNDRVVTEDILNAAIGRFSLENGIFEIETRGKTPFNAHGRNLNAAFQYEAATPRYLGDLSIQPLDVHWSDYAPLPIGVKLAVGIEKDRIQVTSGKLTTGESSVNLAGSLDDLRAPRSSFNYSARVSIADLSRILRVPELERGTVELAGNGTWSEPLG